MTAAADAIEVCLRELERARVRVRQMNGAQIRRADDRDYLKAVAYSWFKSHRPIVSTAVDEGSLGPVDALLKAVLDAADHASAKATYLDALKDASGAIAGLRTAALLPAQPAATPPPPTLDSPPDFSALASDPTMKGILSRRWSECQTCIRAGAPLAATVMMGGLLEALFVARANIMSNKSLLFRAKATPLDAKTKKPLALTEWTLRPYIDVGAELGWITKSGKDVATVLRDYRNYVHPEKERSHGIALNDADASMFWDVTKSLAKQLLASAASAPGP